MPTLATCLRIHRNNNSDKSETPEITKPLELLLPSVLEYSDLVVIACPLNDPNLHRTLLRSIPPSTTVHIVPVYWGEFVPALNSLVHYIASLGIDHAAFQSVEVRISKLYVDTMRELLDNDTLVVGKAFKDHKFSLGASPLTGLTTPWNTFAIWDCRKLSQTGFLMVSEGAIEELAVVTLQQILHPNTSKCKLVKFVDEKMDGWTTNWSDQARQDWHKQKMASKFDRGERQLEMLGLAGKRGVVQGIEIYD